MTMAGDTTALGATASTRASVAAVAGVGAGVLVGLAVASVALSWTVVQTLFTLGAVILATTINLVAGLLR
jgi:hypothetical protein